MEFEKTAERLEALGNATRLGIYRILVRAGDDGLSVGEVQAAGTHRVIWDGRDTAGRRAASGVYFCRLATGDVVETRRMVRIP